MYLIEVNICISVFRLISLKIIGSYRFLNGYRLINLSNLFFITLFKLEIRGFISKINRIFGKTFNDYIVKWTTVQALYFVDFGM